MSVEHLSIAQLADKAQALIQPNKRVILGITGAPGSGKTSLANELLEALGPDKAALLSMDGFHLSNQTLTKWNRRNRKGAWDTFDVGGYVHLLARLKENSEEVIHVPDFERVLDESIGSAIPIPKVIPLLITEGNYLLAEIGEWGGVLPLLDFSWFVELPDKERINRLVQFHVAFGKSGPDAIDWAQGPDQKNAEMIMETRDRASMIVQVQ